MFRLAHTGPGKLSLIGTVVFALRTESLYEGLTAAILTHLGTSYRSHGGFLQRNARQTLGNAAPPVIQNRRIDEKYVPGDDVPREHGEIECIFNPQVEQQAEDQQWIAKAPEPDEDSEGKLQSEGKPTTHL